MAERGDLIRQRLAAFESVDPTEWFWEFAFGILTPQSRARHADIVVQRLREREYFLRGGSVVDLLRSPDSYIRFHNVKSQRLELLRNSWSSVVNLLNDAVRTVPDRGRSSIHEARLFRNELASRISGYGLKEASHVLRNIGWRNLAIIDRHLITNMSQLGICEASVAVGSHRQYHNLENSFSSWCELHGYDMDEMDLLFWSQQTGEIFK